MAFFVPDHPLTPRHQLALDIDPAARIVRADDLAAWVAADEAMGAARAQADALVAATQAAFEAERRRGHAEGTELARREAAGHMVQQVTRTNEYFSQVEDRLVVLVMQGIRKIVQGYDDKERVVHSVRNALSVVRNQKQITLKVNPANVDHVKARTAELLAQYPGVSWLDVVADARLSADCCVLESEIGVVEASTEGQLAALDAAFHKARTAPP